MSEAGSLTDELRALEREARDAIDGTSDPAALERVRVAFLGRREGRVSRILRQLGGLSPEARPVVGAEANRLKRVLGSALEARERHLARKRPDTGRPAPDLTLPGRNRWMGARHPVTRVVDDICDIFARLGFTRARGPEAETEWYNFVALNTPLDHPAADEQDTLYLKGGGLLRSHTSPVQIRILEEHRPPVRILAPGPAYRRDTWDATHAPAFFQIEGLAVDEGINFVDFKATLSEFARRFWGPGTRVRFRPGYFPFTEPSAEVDVKRRVVRADGSVEETAWLEIMGAGMVDPAVLENVGIDPERYSGWAFGMGPARIAMIKYGITDIRTLYENDIRFLSQFA